MPCAAHAALPAALAAWGLCAGALMSALPGLLLQQLAVAAPAAEPRKIAYPRNAVSGAMNTLAGKEAQFAVEVGGRH